MSRSNDDHNGESGPASQRGQTGGEAGGRSRRRLIQLLAAGGVVSTARLVPGQWSSPVIERIVIPAHAQTTPDGKKERRCVLGNNTLLTSIDTPGDAPRDWEPPYGSETYLASGSGATGRSILSALVGEAFAQDEASTCTILTFCFRIVFNCDTGEGTLIASAVDPSADAIQETSIQAPFRNGQPGELGNACFLVTINKDSTAAVLELFCDCGSKPDVTVDLVENFDCEPIFEKDDS